MWCVRVQISRSTIIEPTNMTIQSILIKIVSIFLIKFVLSDVLVVTVNDGRLCLLVEQASKRRITADSVSLPNIPMASEESVHMLTAVRFLPPALFFANPDKKWSLGDFEKPDLVATYSVTDDMTDMRDEQDAYLQQDPAMTTELETEAEAEATTIAVAVDESVNGLQQTTGDKHVGSLKPAGDRLEDILQSTSDALAESLQPTHDLLVDSRSPTASRLVVGPKQQPPAIRFVNQMSADHWSEKRQTAAPKPTVTPSGIGTRPTANPENRFDQPTVSDTRCRFSVARLGERKNLLNFHRQ